jgi:pre-mRNA-processing factor 19
VLAVHAEGDTALVAGNDGACGVISLPDNRVLHALDLGKSAATSGIWAHNRTVVATTKGSVKVFENGQETHSFSNHAGSANAVALHPSGSIVASVGDDQSYALYDLESGGVIARVYSNSGMFDRCKISFTRSLSASFEMCSIPSRWPLAGSWRC